MVEYLTQHLQTVAIDLFRLCLWLAILSVIFVPLERLFALHRAAVFRDGIGTDLAWYFINALLPILLLTHLIHRLFLKANNMHKSYITDNDRRAISLLDGPRFRPYLSGAGG